ncbi:MAG: hypothetical protein DYH00_08950 [Bacteroidetes bacterium CHB6]|nr:hypothetical protein [Bacteroidetes bacterium CHB6]
MNINAAFLTGDKSISTGKNYTPYFVDKNQSQHNIDRCLTINLARENSLSNTINFSKRKM